MKNIPFYIAKRYLFSTKNATAVNIISGISLLVITFATAALMVILSVFSGLEQLNLDQFSDFRPDITIQPKSGKSVPQLPAIEKELDKIQEIRYHSRVIEEKVYLSFNQLEHIAYLKGVEKGYDQIIDLPQTVYDSLNGGRFLSFEKEDEIFPHLNVSNHLQSPSNSGYPIKLMIPKAGEGLIKRESDAFRSVQAYQVGTGLIPDETYENIVFAPISLAEELLNKKEIAYSIECKLEKNIEPEAAKEVIMDALKNFDVKVLSRQELDAAYIKLMRIENLITYLLFTFILIIASFTLYGALVIIILDKKGQVQSMLTFGLSKEKVKQVFFYTGCIITFISTLMGITIASLIIYLQDTFGLALANAFTPYPVAFSAQNYLIVSLTVLAIGIMVSYFATRKLK